MLQFQCWLPGYWYAQGTIVNSRNARSIVNSQNAIFNFGTFVQLFGDFEQTDTGTLTFYINDLDLSTVPFIVTGLLQLGGDVVVIIAAALTECDLFHCLREGRVELILNIPPPPSGLSRKRALPTNPPLPGFSVIFQDPNACRTVTPGWDERGFGFDVTLGCHREGETDDIIAMYVLVPFFFVLLCLCLILAVIAFILFVVFFRRSSSNRKVYYEEDRKGEDEPTTEPLTQASGRKSKPPAVPDTEPGPLPGNKSPTSKKVRVVWDFDANPENEGELSVKSGEILTIVDDSDPDWWVIDRDGVQGHVPKDFVEKVD